MYSGSISRNHNHFVPIRYRCICRKQLKIIVVVNILIVDFFTNFVN